MEHNTEQTTDKKVTLELQVFRCTNAREISRQLKLSNERPASKPPSPVYYSATKVYRTYVKPVLHALCYIQTNSIHKYTLPLICTCFMNETFVFPHTHCCLWWAKKSIFALSVVETRKSRGETDKPKRVTKKPANICAK